MKNLFIVCAFALLFSCAKDEDPREKFLGSFAGMATGAVYVDNVFNSTKTDPVTLKITMGTESNKIVLDGKITASVFDDEFIFDPGQTDYVDIGDGTALKFTLSGSGIITTNRSIILSYTQVASNKGHTFFIKIDTTFEPTD